MVNVVALLLFSAISQANESPWLAPKPPELYPDAALGKARVDSDGVFLPSPLADWTAGFVEGMRAYPAACQRGIDRARDVEHEQCESLLAEQAKAASVVMGDGGLTTLDGVLIGAVSFVVGVAAGVIICAVAK